MRAPHTVNDFPVIWRIYLCVQEYLVQRCSLGENHMITDVSKLIEKLKRNYINNKMIIIVVFHNSKPCAK